MTVGRNDPCPCGSGKKYKKCHGAGDVVALSASPGAGRARVLKTVDIDLSKRLLDFARRNYGADWLQEMADVYTDGDGGEIPDVEMPIAIPWMLYSIKSSDTGLTVGDAWRHDQGKRVTADQGMLLDAYDSMWMSVWEVADVEPGVGTKLMDLLTREERFVHDVSSSKMLERLDAVLAFVLDCDGVSFFGGVHGQPLPPRQSAAVVKEARALCGVRTRPASPDKLRVPSRQLDLIDIWNVEADELRAQPAPALQNTDGDPFEMTTDDYALVASRADVARRLASLEGAQEPQEEGNDLVFAITKAGNPIHASWDNTVVARVVLGARRLEVETNSSRRADSIRAKLEAHMGGTIRHRLRSAANTRDMMERARESPQLPR